VSLDATRWAWDQSVETAPQRLVLTALADLCRRRGELAFPSRERLRTMTRLDPKTIACALRELVALGLISRTGEFRGRSGRIPVYRLNFDAANTSENGAIRSPVNASENGAIRTGNLSGSVTETRPDLPPNGAVSPFESHQKRVDQIAPFSVHRTGVDLEPGKEPGEKEPCRAAGAPLASLPGAAPSTPAPEEQSNGNGAQQEHERLLEAWAAEHQMIRRTGEAASSWRTRIRIAQGKARSC